MTDWLHRDEIQRNNLHRMEQGRQTGYTEIRFSWIISTERNRSRQDPGWPWTKLEVAPRPAQNFVNLEACFVNSTFINRSLSSPNRRKWYSLYPGGPRTKLEVAPRLAQNFVNLEACFVNSTFINRSLSSPNQRKWDSFLINIYIYAHWHAC